MLSFNKEHIAETMTKNTEGLSKSKALEQVDEVILAIIQTLSEGKDNEPNKKGIRAKLTIVGFGSFNLKAVPTRKHRNPQSQKPVDKPPHNAIKFTEGKAFKEFIN